VPVSQLSEQPSDQSGHQSGNQSGLLLPAGTHVIHVGPQKTGSSAIQNAMHAKRDQLLEHGVLYASLGQPRAREAGWYVLGRRAPIGRPTPRVDEWDALCAEVAAADPATRVIVSNEDYGRATPEEIREIVGALGGDRPHVVAVARRIDRFLPSQWQERVKARETMTYEEWLRIILAPHSDNWNWKHIWYPFDVEGLVDRWAAEVGKENVTIVVADDQDRRLLPGAFEQMLGLPAGALDPDDFRVNRSLTLQETELLRLFNLKFVERGWPGEAYRDFVQGGAIKGLKQRVKPADHQSSAGLPDWAVDRVGELCAQHAEAVENVGVRVIGDPSRLRAPELRPGSSTVEAIDLETAARLAEFVLEKALRIQQRQERELRRARRRRRKQARPQGADLSTVSGRELATALGSRLGERVVQRVRRR
jgi:hypothetical protein